MRGSTSSSSSSTETELEKLKKKLAEKEQQLKTEAATADDSYLCIIHETIMRDPVKAPGDITIYERATLSDIAERAQEKKVQPMTPIARVPFDVTKLESIPLTRQTIEKAHPVLLEIKILQEKIARSEKQAIVTPTIIHVIPSSSAAAVHQADEEIYAALAAIGDEASVETQHALAAAAQNRYHPAPPAPVIVRATAATEERKQQSSDRILPPNRSNFFSTPPAHTSAAAASSAAARHRRRGKCTIQ